MYTARIFIINLFFVHLTILSSYVNFAFASPCSRIPQGTGAGRSLTPGFFGMRIWPDGTEDYKPGRTYTIFIERKSAGKRKSDGSLPKFIGFYIAVEQASTPPSDWAEDFSPDKHGVLTFDDNYQSLVRLSCGNVATHKMDTPKSEVRVNWTAPPAGAGTVSIRVTVVESRDVWYMDGPHLMKDIKEDEDAQEDFISNVLDECCACNEAKYELAFEGLWSKHTHPKNFPANEHVAEFSDIIGTTHKVGAGFWKNNDRATDGFKLVAEDGKTQILESELKEKSYNIRTIIKARGLKDPNIRGKTFAVFRVDSENHLVSFVSAIRPSPDWFVGISALELCQKDCTWVESKVLDLYPWDAGTRDGVSYESPPTAIKREYIRRITSEWPANKDSPFYNENGTKMKPLARLTLTRQRLYEKNCTEGQTDGEDCLVTEYGAWGECTGGACDGNGKQYRQRYYKYPDRAKKCRRKLFDTRTCIMPSCTHENEDIPFDDPVCKGAASYTPFGPCTPNCKRTADEMGERTKILKWKTNKAFKECMQRLNYEREITEPCEIKNFCIGPSKYGDFGDSDTPQPTDDDAEQTTPNYDCEGTYRSSFDGECVGSCGVGEKNRTRVSTNPSCEPMIDTVPCYLEPCKNAPFCYQNLDSGTCERQENATNFIYYDAGTCICTVFTTYCSKGDDMNIFETFDECREACQIDEDNCSVSRSPNRRRPREEH